MTDREVLQFKVYQTEKGYICISQDDPGQLEEDVVILHPEQVDLLIKWVLEVKDEINNEE